MGITYNSNFLDKDGNNFKDGVEEKLIEAMKYAGEEFIIACRKQPQGHPLGYYNDKTANLRNSIGYLIYKFGELITESPNWFNSENTAKVSDLISPTGIVLIGIAGMDYASYVESKGYNVMTNQRNMLIVNLGEYMKDIEKSLNING